jgi:predicted nucleotidyltransferase
MKIGNGEISDEALGAVCRKWKIWRLGLFGSARTAEFRPDSDVDFLVEFEPDEQWSLMDLARAEFVAFWAQGRTCGAQES